MQAFGESYRIAGKVIFVHGLALSGAYAPALPKGEPLAKREVQRFSLYDHLLLVAVISDVLYLSTFCSQNVHK